MKKLSRVVFFYVFILFSLPAFGCGTADNWMDAYTGVKSGNEWRDSMNQLESLVMFRSCGGSTTLDKYQQLRMLKILTDAMTRKFQLPFMPTKNHDIRNQVNLFRELLAYEGLVESIFRRYNCLQGVRHSNSPTIHNSNQTIYQYFGENSCPGHKALHIKINAPSGGRLRAWPKGRILATLKDATMLLVLGNKEGWYRVINPADIGNQDTFIGYVHDSIVTKVK